jgi:hypothetical protein
MTRQTRVFAALLGALLVVGLLATNLPAARVAFALAVCLLLPGFGWARKMRFGDVGDTVAMAIVLSICTTVAVGTAMAVSGSWSPEWGLAVLAGIGLAGFVPARLLAARAGAAVRLRRAGFRDDGAAQKGGLGPPRDPAAGKGQAGPRRSHRQRGFGGEGGLVRRAPR